MLEKHLNQQRRDLLKRLEESGVVMIDQNLRSLDVLVKYRWRGYGHEVTFMQEMLDAEVWGMVDQLLGDTE